MQLTLFASLSTGMKCAGTRHLNSGRAVKQGLEDLETAKGTGADIVVQISHVGSLVQQRHENHLHAPFDLGLAHLQDAV